jgi:hypothetical protein
MDEAFELRELLSPARSAAAQRDQAVRIGGQESTMRLSADVERRRARVRANRLIGCGAAVLLLALWLPATSALAQVPNGNFTLADGGEPDTTGVVNHNGATNSGTAQTICRNGSNTVTVSGATTHPESVRLANNKSSMEQRSVGNFPTVRVIGAGAQVFNVVVACDSAAYRSNVNYAPNVRAGKFSLDVKNCTGLTEARATYLNDTCTADVANTTIKFTIDVSTITKLKLQGKGSIQ